MWCIRWTSAKAVGAERLREIMAGLLDRAAAVVTRYGGTLDKFTGDGDHVRVRAPVALEDHAVAGVPGRIGDPQRHKRFG